VPDIEKTSALVKEISLSGKEQTVNAEQINSALQQLNQVIQQNAAVSEEVAASSEELMVQAEQLRQSIGFFRINEQPNYKTAVPATYKRKPVPNGHVVQHKSNGVVKKSGHKAAMAVKNGDHLDNEYEQY
jgi:methyl-accepting chemotaxis protein